MNEGNEQGVSYFIVFALYREVYCDRIHNGGNGESVARVGTGNQAFG